MKLLYFTDAHLRGTTPRSRNDDYLLAMEQKFDEISEIIRDNNIEAVLNGGDLFHTPSPAYSVVSTFTKKMKSWGIPIYSVIGSHDRYGYNASTLNRTAKGMLEAAGIVQIIDSPLEISKGLFICGNSHDIDLDDSPLNYYMPRPENCEYMIQLVHGMLVETPFFGKHTLIKDVDTDADLVLIGHFHFGFGPIVKGKTTYLNIGSLGRVENVVRKFPPSILIINTDKRVYNIVNLKVVNPSPFITMVKQDNVSMDMEGFILNLQSKIEGLDTYDVYNLITHIGEQEGISEEIVQEALKYIKEE